ncbi:MAG: DUF4398 domain-containing protein [Polyangiales bacterium]|nr:DUF4398 domain-containing protein [Myxococcales bacterium]
MPRAVRSALRIWLALVAFVAAGCGPVTYTMRVSDAVEAVEAAEQAGALELAPYEYHTARTYLDRARDLASEAEYGLAVRYADTAKDAARKATDVARVRAQRRSEVRR